MNKIKMKKSIVISVTIIMICMTLFSACEPEKQPAQSIPQHAASDIYARMQSIASIPRSGESYPKEINEYISEQLDGISVDYKVDKSGNVFASIPGSKGNEDKPHIVLEASTYAEIDVEPGTKYEKEPVSATLSYKSSSDIISAADTSFGAGSAFGIASLLCALKSLAAYDDIAHYPVDAIFMVNPDNPKYYENALALVKVDSGNSEVLYTASEGAMFLSSTKKITPIETTNKNAFVLAVTNYPGEAHGADVDPLQNPIATLIDILTSAKSAGIAFELCSIEADPEIGNKAPQDAIAMVALGDYELNKFRQLFNSKAEAYMSAYADDEAEAVMIETKVPEWSVSPEDTEAILTHIYGLMTSNETGSMKDLSGIFCSGMRLSPVEFNISMSLMAANPEALSTAEAELQGITILSGIDINRGDTIPAYDTDAKNDQVKALLKICKKEYSSKISIGSSSRVSELGYIHEMDSELPLMTLAMDVDMEGTADENMIYSILPNPINALIKYIYSAK
jgi:hypothetical protein